MRNALDSYHLDFEVGVGREVFQYSLMGSLKAFWAEPFFTG